MNLYGWDNEERQESGLKKRGKVMEHLTTAGNQTCDRDMAHCRHGLQVGILFS